MELLRVKSNMNIEEWMAKEANRKIAVHEVRAEYFVHDIVFADVADSNLNVIKSI